MHSTDPSMTCRHFIPNHIIAIIHSNMPPKAFSQSFTALKILLRFPTAENYEHIEYKMRERKGVPIGIRIVAGPLFTGSVKKKR